VIHASPLVSVVIPTFNRSDLLIFAIQSVLRQTVADLELVVSDNCSTDDTPSVVSRFGDSRIRYVRTPQHYVLADNWEFARAHARGTFLMFLADDDALIATALERFTEESRRFDADFLCSAMAQYRDRYFPGPRRNSLEWPAFSGSARSVTAEEFVKPLFDFRPRLNMHPSAFVFARRLAEAVAARCGRFFQTNGVEYCAWPLAAVGARRIVHIDAPLVIAGRTGKSWGSNVVLGNPGKTKIDKFIADADQCRRHAPLSNFTFCNLMAEGILTAKHLCPKEFESYQFDERVYLLRTYWELCGRQAIGVDVSREMSDLVAYARKYPSLPVQRATGGAWRRVRSKLVALGARALRDNLRDRRRRRRDAIRVRRGGVQSDTRIHGKDFGLTNILECTAFLTTVVRAAHSAPNASTAGAEHGSPTLA
jgi:hypothetical protein